jgi:hypothetical protein
MAHYGLKKIIQQVHILTLFFRIPMIDGHIRYYFDVIFILKIQALVEVLVLCFSKKINLRIFLIKLNMDFTFFKHFLGWLKVHN